jgi:putative NADH-flavin reductase
MDRLRGLLYQAGLALLLLADTGIAAARNQHIVVYGATGAIGSVITQEALRRGDNVVGVARDPTKLKFDNPRYTGVRGDVTDLDSFRRITRGADAVIIAVLANGKGNAPQDSASARAAKIAVKAYSGVTTSPHIIQIGGAPTMYPTREAMLAHLPGMGLQAPPGSPLYGTIMGHWIALQTYRASDIRWTVLTPPLDIQGWTPDSPPQPHRTGAYRSSTTELVQDAQGHNAINIADLAVAAVDEAEHPRFIGKRFTVGY